jgi:hypothetical protein
MSLSDEERRRIEEEERVRAEARLRAEAEARAKLEAEAEARRQEDEAKKKDADKQASKKAEKKVQVGCFGCLGLIALLVGLGYLADATRSPEEKAAQQRVDAVAQECFDRAMQVAKLFHFGPTPSKDVTSAELKGPYRECMGQRGYRVSDDGLHVLTPDGKWLNSKY